MRRTNPKAAVAVAVAVAPVAVAAVVAIVPKAAAMARQRVNPAQAADGVAVAAVVVNPVVNRPPEPQTYLPSQSLCNLSWVVSG
jgi:hypothetical protein